MKIVRILASVDNVSKPVGKNSFDAFKNMLFKQGVKNPSSAYGLGRTQRSTKGSRVPWV